MLQRTVRRGAGISPPLQRNTTSGQTESALGAARAATAAAGAATTAGAATCGLAAAAGRAAATLLGGGRLLAFALVFALGLVGRHEDSPVSFGGLGGGRGKQANCGPFLCRAS